jgi:hypothetical protein
VKYIPFKFALASIIILLCFGCDSVTGPIHNPTVRTITTYQGTWAGTTSEGYTVSFTVIGNRISSFTIDILSIVPNKPAEKLIYYFISAGINSDSIAGSDFSIKVYRDPSSEPSMGIGLPISGHFTSTAAAEGTSQPVTGPSGVTWTAAKN